MQIPNTYARDRAWAADDVLDLRNYPALDTAWQNSQRLLTEIDRRLGAAELAQEVLTVAACGSLGRMEAVDGSDADLIVVLRDGVAADSVEAQRACDRIWSALEPVSLDRSRRGGIFAIPTTSASLCSIDARGKIDEDIPTFGKRFQLLCDAQPVYGAAAYEQLLSGVIAWYTAVPADDQAVPWWRYLLNDLIRYYRSMCAAAQWDRSVSPGFARMRRFKLAHSRTVMYAALLCVLGECSTAASDPRQRLHAALHLTPLERLAWSYASADDSGIAPVAAVVNGYLERLGNAEFRKLVTCDAPAAAPVQPESLPSDARALRRELSRFLSAQQRRWDGKFGAGLWI